MHNELFVWRTLESDAWLSRRRICPICSTALHKQQSNHGDRIDDLYRTKTIIAITCPLCGWEYEGTMVGYQADWASGYPKAGGVGEITSTITVLDSFEINSPQIGLDELGGFLKRNVADVYTVSPRRFEELTADVFRAHGFRVALTQSTRDGGADVLLLRHESKEIFAIVECKRYASDRQIGVSLVRTLVGAAVAWDVRRAFLVTTSGFSPDARDLVTDYRRFGYDIDLVGLSELVSLLGVYNPNLPRLDHLTPEMRAEIVAVNRRAYGESR